MSAIIRNKSKKKLLFVFFFLCLAVTSLFAEEDYCCFCDPMQAGKQLVHETEEILTVYCSKPATKGHLLIIPKRHVEKFGDLTAKEMLLVQQEVNKFVAVFKEVYQVPDFVLIQKNGRNAGQTVPHLHFHMIPSPESFYKTMLTALNHRDTISDTELKECTDELKDALDWL